MTVDRSLLEAGVLALLLTLAAGAAPARAADTFNIDPNHSEVSFQVRHFVTPVRGEFGNFGGTVVMDAADPSSSSVQFWINTESIDTRNDRRDQHLRSEDFFYVEKNPQITFQSDKVEKTGENTYDVSGTLTMRGVSQQVTLPVTYLGSISDGRGNTRAGFSTGTTLNRKDYGINWNQALDQGGFVLGDDVSVAIDLETIQKKDDGDQAGR